MLRMRFGLHALLVASSLCAASPCLAQGSAGLGAKLDAAEKKLDDDIKACRPIDVEDYKKLVSEGFKNIQTALKTAKGGAPVDTTVINADYERAKALRDRAQAAAAKPCPPQQQQPQNATPPPKKVEPPTEPPRPLTGGVTKLPKDPFDELEDDAEDALDELDEAMYRCDEEWVKAIIPDLEKLSKRAHDAAEMARAADKFSRIDPREARAMADDLDEAIADAKKFKCPSKPPKPPPRSFPMRLSPFDQRILVIHNEERTAIGVAPLSWSANLEWSSMAYARHLAETQQLVHAPREGRGIERENLLQARIGWSPDRMMQGWTIEKRNFRPGLFPDVAIDGNWLNVAHYTQMIWPTTTDIGCGYAEGGGFGWLVCRYSPGGNKDGKPVGYPAAEPATTAGPLLFEKIYSPVLKANRPANPDGLEHGDDAVYFWGVFEYARDFGHSDWAFGTLDKLKFYSQAAREHSTEERTKGNTAAAEQYAAMAQQLDNRVAAGEADMKKRGYQRSTQRRELERG